MPFQNGLHTHVFSQSFSLYMPLLLLQAGPLGSFLVLFQLFRSPPQAARTVRRVGRAVAAASGNIGRSFEWDFLVIRDDQTNAFVLPGGKVCVFTGLFKVCPTEDALAAVLAHEVGHAVANHFGEKLSKAFVVNLLLLGLVLMGFQYDHLARMVTNLVNARKNSLSRLLISAVDGCVDSACLTNMVDALLTFLRRSWSVLISLLPSFLSYFSFLRFWSCPIRASSSRRRTSSASTSPPRPATTPRRCLGCSSGCRR
ncbi:unnamed protein product [Phaeothamnion confervicola]